ncbi:pilus assembly PilX family protein [Microbulbifer hydrolyticus]|uniref:Pilus assembly protein PilX n=1 Tax=Microbulbifer hydrolyticus TaxID=48074 RepID=A0A6P1TAH8_9GAMM|nr:PilX N-terminal domain-containing pilus assembly protein [Microbulbifer hydrolyticus]MBB5210913.1 type IV pilus assembly protein PilX [Microbulbifer hydrolyticus]QHQ38269.1 pilus assembly protein PilX [Microbulbifer hydrolyticus]
MKKITSFSTVQRQQGMTLIVGLIMVLLMTIVGMAAIRGSGMQELMAGNMRDRNLAFQSAEAGLRQGEVVLTGATIPAFDGTSTGLVQAIDGSTSTGFWDTYGWDASSVRTTLGVEYVASQPQYVIEEVSTTAIINSADGGAVDFASSLKMDDTVFYRVTSRAEGGTADAVVILQSTYKR